jgi:hypothetical protein
MYLIFYMALFAISGSRFSGPTPFNGPSNGFDHIKIITSGVATISKGDAEKKL